MKTIDPQIWKQELPEFRRQTEAFYAGELKQAAYKGFSGFYGSYAQRGGQASMLRLRMPAGRVTKERLAFVAEAVRKYAVKRIHFTTCQTIQLHDLDKETVCSLIEEALDAGIVTLGGGGDFPRNVMCSPLSGVDPEEYFDVLPYAEAAGAYLLQFIKAEKMPRKLKVGFSNSPKNVTHATYRDLGFVARPDGKFDVYSAGGLGNNPQLGVRVAEAVEPEQILYYIKAMWLTFRAYGNYENRGKARTRYMQEALGGPEQYAKAYREKLDEVFASGEDLTLRLAEPGALTAEKVEHKNEKASLTGETRMAGGVAGIPAAGGKTGDGSTAEGARVLLQKQSGLYTVCWHPIGGRPSVEEFCAVNEVLQGIEGAELRLAPDEGAYIINLTGAEAGRVLGVTEGGAQTLFETSVACIGASVCQVGVRDSQSLLAACVAAVREAKLPDGALPQIHISGCPSSCGTHQTGALGFRGGVKRVDGKPVPGFVLYVNGREQQGEETMGRELGTIAETEIPKFLVALGQAVASSKMDYESWRQADPSALEAVAAKYL